jgi:hypothetical protein
MQRALKNTKHSLHAINFRTKCNWLPFYSHRDDSPPRDLTKLWVHNRNWGKLYLLHDSCFTIIPAIRQNYNFECFSHSMIYTNWFMPHEPEPAASRADSRNSFPDAGHLLLFALTFGMNRILIGSWDSLVSTVTGSFHGRGNYGIFCLRHRVQTSSGAYPASSPMSTADSFPGGKVVGV